MPRYTQRHRLEETPDRFVSARLNKHLFGGRARAWCIIRCAWQRAGEGWGGRERRKRKLVRYSFFFVEPSNTARRRASLRLARFTSQRFKLFMPSRDNIARSILNLNSHKRLGLAPCYLRSRHARWSR
jgi:hypothetical protein